MKRIIYLAIALIFSMNLATIPAYAKEDSHSLVSQLVVLPQDRYYEAEADKMMDRLSAIPANLLEGLKDHGVKIKLANGKITDEPEFASYKGVIPRGWENTGLTWDDVPGVSMNIVIVRIGYSNKGKGHNGQNLELHETFHAIDRLVLNNISSSQAFVDLWKKEANNDYEGDGYVSAYAEEYFAETATLYFYSEKTRDRLKEDMPSTYEFLDKLFVNAG
ncbi:anthrax toxin lethal factor-related metalloendopeptidase [Paenibacillus macerans]|uniref:anthrax toxin lethal factor-related metalloendopeptidase n=1 Tax=Paenibacillus macerans TaxID=44252 RepID=UPI003D31A412